MADILFPFLFFEFLRMAGMGDGETCPRNTKAPLEQFRSSREYFCGVGVKYGILFQNYVQILASLLQTKGSILLRST